VREVKRVEALRQRSLLMNVINSSKDRAMFGRNWEISIRNWIAKHGAIHSHRAVNFLTQDFDYHLPEERIASRPLADRAASRMMVVHRDSGTIEHRMFRDFPEYLNAEDLLVLNDTKVIPARLFSNDGKSELLCLDRSSPTLWRCLVKPGKKMRVGATIQIAEAIGSVVEVYENGDRLIEWDREIDLNVHGHLALPHYMNRDDEPSDRDRYQTVFAREEGAIAAPTAGLHFTPELLDKLPHVFLTLHVGVGTFRPVKAERPEDHEMHSENFHVSAATSGAINHAGRVVAVGTTVTRVLEHLAKSASPGERIPVGDHSGSTDIFIYPPYQLRAIDALLTNFHLPQSTLLMLVSAFASRDLILEAYRQAVEQEYRFYSYGDCMLIL
jgi:S-adenosylmethionine:tRNA ribosyltransferase-isomerase